MTTTDFAPVRPYDLREALLIAAHKGLVCIAAPVSEFRKIRHDLAVEARSLGFSFRLSAGNVYYVSSHGRIVLQADLECDTAMTTAHVAYVHESSQLLHEDLRLPIAWSNFDLDKVLARITDVWRPGPSIHDVLAEGRKVWVAENSQLVQIPENPKPLMTLAAEVRRINEANGWDMPLDTPIACIANIALIITEASEAIEEVRDTHMGERFTIDDRRVYRVTDGSGADWTTDPRGSTAEVGSYKPFTWTGVTAKPEGLPSELADIIIRTLDTASRLGIDLDAHVATKLAYNRTRGLHHGGKVL